MDVRFPFSKIRGSQKTEPGMSLALLMDFDFGIINKWINSDDKKMVEQLNSTFTFFQQNDIWIKSCKQIVFNPPDSILELKRNR